MRIEMDESEGSVNMTERDSLKWWECLDETHSFVRFHYKEIMEQGSDDLKRAVEIVLGGHKPAVHTKEDAS